MKIALVSHLKPKLKTKTFCEYETHRKNLNTPEIIL